MNIVVQGNLIDTKEIYDIISISDGRTAGFIIKLIGKEDISIQKSIPYERTPSQISYEKKPYDELMKKVYEKWQSDKTDIEIFKL